MDRHVIVPIVLFLCVTYGVKLLVDARMRWLLWRLGTSEDQVRDLLRDEERRRRLASLNWGVTLLALAAGFGLIQAFGGSEITPGVIAVLAAATGLGNLACYVLSRRYEP